MTSKRTYFPTAGWDWALPICDPLAKPLGGDAMAKCAACRGPGACFISSIWWPSGFSFWRLFKHTLRFEFCTEEQIFDMMRKAGLTDPRKTGEYKVWFGHVKISPQFRSHRNLFQLAVWATRKARLRSAASWIFSFWI